MASNVEIEQHRRAISAELLPYDDRGWFLWFDGSAPFKRRAQCIYRNQIGDASTIPQAIDYIERQIVAAGYEVKPLIPTGDAIAAWALVFTDDP